jgi:hypothetical protein
MKVLADPCERLPVKKAGADNNTKCSKFANNMLKEAKVNVCYAHASGDGLIMLLLAY